MKRYLVQTFGCQMNVHDSRRIEEVLEADGYSHADDPSLANVLVVNTCSVREKAEHKLMSLLGTFRPLKEARPDLVIAVAGCVAQQEGEKLLKKAPFVDLIIGPDNIPELPDLVHGAQSGAPPRARTEFDLVAPEFLVARPRVERPDITAYVTVMKGCDERCTYCIVPYTRGPERYRPEDEIVGEIVRLVEGGVREVTLLGQTVNSWYDPSRPKDRRDSEFAGLLRRIVEEAPDLCRLRYTSPHPRHVTPELLRAHAELEPLSPHVHLPVQSGSNRLLKRMLRRYTRELYLEKATALKGCREGLTLSTDIIVGFPGETEEDFLETLSLVREAGFVSVFGFKYSPRPFTPALKLGDDVSEADKDDRLQRLFAVAEEQQQAHLRSLDTTRQRVLIEGRSKHGHFSGRTERHEIVHVDAPEGVEPIGEVVEVDVVRANRHSLNAVMDGATYTPSPKPKGPRRLPMVSGGGSAQGAKL